LCADPKSAKRHCLLDCLFVLLGSARVKDLSKHVGEINPRCLDDWGIGGSFFIQKFQSGFFQNIISNLFKQDS
jgi:hypothetical protein